MAVVLTASLTWRRAGPPCGGVGSWASQPWLKLSREAGDSVCLFLPSQPTVGPQAAEVR